MSVRNPRPGIRYDKRGRIVPARSSGVHCEECGIVFALGFLPVDGGRVCRECRADPRPDRGDDQPDLFSDTPNTETAPAV